MGVELLLKKIALFSSLNEDELSKAANITTSKNAIFFKKGSVIFEEGVTENTLYLIKAGKIGIVKTVGGKKVTVDELSEGSFFGEMALLDQGERSATAVALEDSELFIVSKMNFIRFLNTDPIIAAKVLYTLARILSQRIRDTNNKLNQFVEEKKVPEAETLDQEFKKLFSTL